MSSAAQYTDAYIRALDRKDFSTVAAVLHEATLDPELDKMLQEADLALLEEDMALLKKLHEGDGP